MDDGFIKIHRKMLNWEWFTDPNTLAVFLYLLLNANWEDSRFKGIDVPRGSLITGRKKIAKDLNISERSVRTSINHLKTTNEVTTKTTNKFTLVTIVKWDYYQGYARQTDQQNDQQNANNRPTSDHIKEYKEYKNIRREELVASSYNEICTNLKPCRLILTKARAEKISELFSGYNLEEIREGFIKANKTEWLIGKNPKGWRADFDWLIDINNFVKVTEGRYDDMKAPAENKESHYDFEALEREAREAAGR